MTPRTPGSARKEEENPHGNGDLYGFRDSKGITSGEGPGQSCCRAGIATLHIKKIKDFGCCFVLISQQPLLSLLGIAMNLLVLAMAQQQLFSF